MSSVMSSAAPPGPVEVVYDGECPFCASYVALLRLRERVGEVRLIDARRANRLSFRTPADKQARVLARTRPQRHRDIALALGPREQIAVHAVGKATLETTENRGGRVST